MSKPQLIKSIRSIASYIAHAPLNIVRAIRMVYDPATSVTYYPETEQKLKWQMVLDNIAWVIKHKHLNREYYPYGLDRKNGPRPSQYLSNSQLMNIIERQISGREKQATVGLLSDKYIFALVAQALNYPTPRNVAFIDQRCVEWLSPRKIMSHDDFLAEQTNHQWFCKPVSGRQAQGAFTLTVHQDHFLVNGNPVSPQDLPARLSTRSLVQENVLQHEELARLHSSSINTIRLVTLYKNRQARPLAAALRIGARGAVYDNWSTGGMVVHIDLSTGTLCGRGFFKMGNGGAVTHHPDSQILLDGYRLPMFHNAVEIACRFHRDLGHLPTIGWDLAITPEGPCIIEGNTHWNANIYMALEPNFKKRYLDAIENI